MKFDKVINEVCKKKKKNKKKKLSEEYAVESFAVGATSTGDVQGLPTRLPKGKKKKDKIVRRVIKNPVTHIGSITL